LKIESTAKDRISLIPYLNFGAASESAEKTEASVNWLEEYAVYQLTQTKQMRLGWMLYFSPTMNYKAHRRWIGLFSVSEIQSVPLAMSFSES
jgi:hypothetical protein